MHPTRLVLWFLGIVLALAAVGILLVETGLNRLIPAGLAAAGVLLILGLIIISFGERTPVEHKATHEEHAPPVEHRPVDVEEHRVEEHGRGGSAHH